MRSNYILATVSIIFILTTSPACAQKELTRTDAYLAIQNRVFGAISVILPNNSTKLLIGRVVTPAETIGEAGESSGRGVVDNTGPYGILIGLGNGRVLRLMPSLSSLKVPPGTIVLNLGDTKLLPQALNVKAGSPVFVSAGKQFQSIGSTYVPHIGDVLALPLNIADRVGTVQELKDLGAAYVQQLLWTAVQNHLVVANGMLTIHPHLSVDEPRKVFAVMLTTDGQLSDLTNKDPFTLNLDTRTIPDGVHTIAISAMDKRGMTITSASKLIMVYNHVFGPPVPAPQQSSPLNH